VTALLEYLDLALIAHSWFSHYNSLDWNSILLNHWRALQNWLIHPHTNFQLIVLYSLSGRSGILLVILDCIIITHRWYFCNIFMVFSLISFKPQKVWGSIVNLSLYQFSASCHAWFTLRHDNILAWIIANSFASVYHILTKLDTKMWPYTTFMCTKFQGKWITCFHFMVTFTPWQKKTKKLS